MRRLAAALRLLRPAGFRGRKTCATSISSPPTPACRRRSHWATIEAQLEAPGAVRDSLQLRSREAAVHGDDRERRSAEARRGLEPLPGNDGPIEVELDGQTLARLAPSVEKGSRRSGLARKSSTWSAMAEPVLSRTRARAATARSRTPSATGSCSCTGQRGRAEENAWSLARARYDAEVFGYRGNGSVDIVSDVDVPRPDQGGRVPRPRRDPLRPRREPRRLARAPGRQPGPGAPGAGPHRAASCRATTSPVSSSVLDPAAIGPASASWPAPGMPGLRLTGRLPYFVSGVAYPDVSVFSALRPREGRSAPPGGRVLRRGLGNRDG